jgi:acetylornithine deacetylase
MRIASALTGANAGVSIPFGTEAGWFQARGLSTIVLGPGSIEQAHAADEFIKVAQIAECEGVLERLLASMIVHPTARI